MYFNVFLSIYIIFYLILTCWSFIVLFTLFTHIHYFGSSIRFFIFLVLDVYFLLCPLILVYSIMKHFGTTSGVFKCATQIKST